MGHIPVLLSAILEYAVLDDNSIVFDATIGAAGHCIAILEKYKDKRIKYYGLDRDFEMLELSKNKLSGYENVVLIHNKYENIGEEIEKRNLEEKIDFCLFDLGVSSVHLDTAERGFSFRFDAPLDMRLDRSENLTAANIVNNYSAEELADIFYQFGEERLSRCIARKIIEYRKTKKIESTQELADIVKAVYPISRNNQERRIHPATRVFQALRIAVNGELIKLAQSLKTAAASLKKNGRLAVISFHSLEDRIVKNTFKKLAE
ncbi:MAG TPA: 16S rRNA (cytosine(1402)-N(4))-methyltransferase RsmH, partial [bacterium]|nr:16S rRNA (cytosine(1402)-N(4))-methyltransferase RsmH [bacterium]